MPGGKLVAVTVRADGSARRWRVRIDGDFFIESESDAQSDALLHDIEQALSGIRTEAPAGSAAALEGASVERDAAAAVMQAIARHPNARLIGTDAAAIATAYARAVGVPPATRADAAAPASRSGASDSSPVPTTAPESASPASVPAVSAPIASVPAESDDFAERWARLWPCLDIIHDVPRSPAEQMALDERWAREVASGRRRPTLRIWEWNAPCVVVGRFQSIRDEVHEDVARAEGIEVVRRCTGGGAMFIEPGNTITYSLYAPLWFVEGIDVARSYRLCDRWLVGALRGMGLDVRFSGLNDIASQHGKIGGAAQRRFPAGAAGGLDARNKTGYGSQDGMGYGTSGGGNGACETGRGPGAVLHHVTMAYDIDAAKMGRVLNTSKEKMRDKAVRSAVKRVDPLKSQTGLDREEVIARMIDYARAQA